MSEDFQHESSSKLLLKCTNSLKYFNELSVENDSSEEEINVVDHMYATNIENGDLSDNIIESPPFNCQTAESEVKLIKEWLILHTDLIQQQNDDILDKDREIYILRKENEMLKERINCIEKGIPFELEENNTQPNKEKIIIEDMTQGSLKEEVEEANQVVEEQYCPNDNCSTEVLDFKDENQINISDCETQVNKSAKESDKYNISLTSNSPPVLNNIIELKKEQPLLEDTWKSDDKFLSDSLPLSEYSFTVNNISEFDPMKNLRMSIRRKRVKSSSSGISHSELPNLEEKDSYRRRLKKKKRRLTKDTNILTSLEAYVTQSHEVDLGIPQSVDVDIAECLSTTLEVPRWRHKIYASCYTMEGTENLDDEVFNKRHMRLEIDERRRKRWDVQRIREQRVIEKLKQRQEKIGLGSKNEDQEPVASLWPKVEDIKYLEVNDELPVAAFGASIAKFNPSEFQIPWLNNPSYLSRKSHNRKSSIRRRGSKR